MYEEEDDDLPMQYRRLTAHLQTSNADFDRRLAAYLTNHVAMRTALGQAVSDSYGHQQQANQSQQYANAPQFTNPSLLAPSPSPLTSAQDQQQQNGQADGSKPSPTTYNASPYPLATQQAFQAAMHGRSASVANHLSTLGPNSLQNSRRASTFGQTTNTKNKASTNMTDVKSEIASRSTSSTSPIKPLQQQQPSALPPAFNNFGDFDAGSLSPFSTTLPPQSQQLLGGALDPNDPMTSMLMGGSPQPFYSYNPNGDAKNSFTSMPNRALGINQTLSPGFMDFYNNDPIMAQHDNSRVAAPASMSLYDSGIAFDGGLSYDDMLQPSGLSSDTSTPQHNAAADADWQSLFNENLWEEQQPSSQPAAAV